MSIQDFGPEFSLEKLMRAREVAREICSDLSSRITPGMQEEEANQIYKELCSHHQISKQWHPTKIRFGPNTKKAYREPSDPYVLKEEDIFFIDIGPVMDGHEADYGETFVIGSDFEQKRIAETCKKVFEEVADEWRNNKTSGIKLYAFAEARANHYGYTLNQGMDGHRLGDFPHHVHFKGGLAECEEVVLPNAWVLEIHLWHPSSQYGAFYEDLLTL